MGEYIYKTRPACQRPSWLTVKERNKLLPGWKLVDYAYIPAKEPTTPEECSDCNNTGTNIYVRALDAAGNYLSGEWAVFSTPDEDTTAMLRPRGQLDYCYDPQGITYYGQSFFMDAGSSFAPDPPRNERGPLRMRMNGNSDELNGMGLPLRRHVQFVLTFQRVEEENTEPPDPPSPETQWGPWYVKSQTARKIVTVRDPLPQ